MLCLRELRFESKCQDPKNLNMINMLTTSSWASSKHNGASSACACLFLKFKFVLVDDVFVKEVEILLYNLAPKFFIQILDFKCGLKIFLEDFTTFEPSHIN